MNRQTLPINNMPDILTATPWVAVIDGDAVSARDINLFLSNKTTDCAQTR